MTRGGVLALGTVAAVLLANCGAGDPALRLRAEHGRQLVYAARRVDDWPDAKYGYGGTLDTRVRFRLATEEAVAGRGGRYQVVVEAVRVASPPRFGVAVDTDTPDAEEGDTRGVEELARRFLRRHGELTISELGLAAGVEPDRELRAGLKAWGDTQPDPRAALPVMTVLDELLDGPRVAATWIQGACLLLPPGAEVPAAATWKRLTPSFGSPAGKLAAELDVSQEREEGRVTLRARGPYRLVEALDDAPLAFVSGTFEAHAVLATARGVLLRYEETTAVVFRRVQEGGETTATWHRTLTLAE